MGKKGKDSEKKLHTAPEYFQHFMEQFQEETDRAAVILGAAKLDSLLYDLLVRVLRPSTSGADDLLDGEAPLSTFSAKIRICYRLNVVDDEFARALHLVRRIRNDFAHETSAKSLNEGGHRDRVKALVAPLREYEPFNMSIRVLMEDTKHRGPAADFRAALAVMIVPLEMGAEAISYMRPELTLRLRVADVVRRPASPAPSKSKRSRGSKSSPHGSAP